MYLRFRMPNVRAIEVFQADGVGGRAGVLPRSDNVRSHAATFQAATQRRLLCRRADKVSFGAGLSKYTLWISGRNVRGPRHRATAGGVRFNQLLVGGLPDQIATLERVQEDIAAFAGDRTDVTIRLNAGGTLRSRECAG
jgi:hypothetical protein